MDGDEGRGTDKDLQNQVLHLPLQYWFFRERTTNYPSLLLVVLGAAQYNHSLLLVILELPSTTTVYYWLYWSCPVQPQSTTGYTGAAQYNPSLLLVILELPSTTTVCYWLYWSCPVQPQSATGYTGAAQYNHSLLLEGNRNWNHNEGDVISCQSGPGQNEALPTSPQDAGSKLVVVPGNNRTVISEKLEIVRKWGITTYMCTRQTLSERLGTGSRTVDLDLEPQLEDLSENQQRYSHLTKLADTLANQVAQFAATQKSLGDAFADLSIKSPTLHVEFGVNADAQHFLSKRGEELAVAVGSFSSEVNTLVSRTIEDTMVNVKQYHSHRSVPPRHYHHTTRSVPPRHYHHTTRSVPLHYHQVSTITLPTRSVPSRHYGCYGYRVEYDAYRCDLEELNLGPRDVSTRTKLEQAERNLQNQRKRYLQSRDDLSVKLRLLEENKVKVLQRQLLLLQAAGASHNLSCHQHLQAKLQERSIQLDSCPALDSLSWLESSC
ncbi:Arfaptin-1 [Merluccius polli]|uniref:Arfaptin-1 n=1 Tax=Merluccius polli TaxID=89951 RepID=A0AA47NYC7_MERPO|nr:Arfaptin-1 [Merluccius polli]